jgi:protein SFI1
MSQRRATAVAEPSDKRRLAPSSASIISSAAGSSSSTSNLQPFEGLSSPEIAFIDAIIRRVPSRDTNFVPVFKAYQDEFEARGQNATNDEFYFNLLLKLGMIRADNWRERWRTVCEYWGYEVSSPLSPEEEEMSEDLDARGAPHEHTPKQRDVIRRVDYEVGDGEDDAFTLHSAAESAQYSADLAPPPPPSYHSKRPAKPGENRPSRINPVIERTVSSSTLSRVDTGSGAGVTHRRRVSSVTLHDGTQCAPQDEEEAPSPAAAVPPSYHTNPRVRRTSARASDQVAISTQEGKPQTRDDAETWRIIQMERDADMFRREFLLSCCLDVWVKGLRWVEARPFSIPLAYSQYPYLLNLLSIGNLDSIG